MKIAAERLRELIAYDPITGVFQWKVDRGFTARAGRVAGCLHQDYWRIKIDYQPYQAHQLAWLYVHGVWPTYEIDHLNEVKTDNRIVNLADKTRSQNMHNISGPRRTNTTGFRGVKAKGHRWQARICIDGKPCHLGTFNTPEKAYEAYLAARSTL